MRRCLLAVLALMLAGGDAHADEHEHFLLFSFPVAVGASSTDGAWGFAGSWRPEVVAARVDDDAVGWGLGVYGDLTMAYSGRNQAWFGGGVSLVSYREDFLAFELSAGLSHGSEQGYAPVVGGFVGFRFPILADDELYLDIPIGLRVDVRRGQGATPTTTSIQLELDGIGIDALLFKVIDRMTRDP